MRDIATKVDNVGDTLSAGEFNSDQNELENAVTNTGQSLDGGSGPDADLNMLGKAMGVYGAGGGDFYADSGAVNAYVLSKTGSFVNAPAYYDGMSCVFVVGNTNTGASTVNVSGLGVVNITQTGGTALTGTELVLNRIVGLRYNTTGPRFELVLLNPILQYPRGHIDGLLMSNGTDSDHDIDVSIGECRNSAESGNITASASITKQIDATWVAGDAAGGRASGVSLSNNTWYHLFALGNVTDFGYDFGFDTSITASNLLADAVVIAAGFTTYRRIGSVLTDGSANIIGFKQVNNKFYWDDPPLDINTSINTTATDFPLSTPEDIKVFPIMNVQLADAGNFRLLYIRSKDINDELPSSTAGPLATISNLTAGGSGYTQIFGNIYTDTSRLITARADGGPSNFRGVTLGWEDPRGKE